MKSIQPQKPSHITPHAYACLNALVKAGLASHISLGGGLGLFHYLDYRPTHDVDAWWVEFPAEEQRQAVIQTIQNALSQFGDTRLRKWGEVVSIELFQEGKVVFSFQIASRTVRLEEPVSAGWIDVPLDSLTDLTAAKMTALVERGAPRDFLDIFTLCRSQLLTVGECWNLWAKRQSRAGSDADMSRARLAIESHLERIAAHRPLDRITDGQQREQARQLREWFLNVFFQVSNE